MIEFKNIKIKDLIPSNICTTNVKNIAIALDSELLNINNNIKQNLIISRISELPENVIDSLAWQFRVDNYNNNANIDIKRDMVKKSIIMHKRKGTKGAVRTTAENVFPKAELKENWEYDGDPYCFRIDIENTKIENNNSINTLIENIEVMKNKRSHLDEIRIIKNIYLLNKISVAVTVHKTIEIGG